MKSPLDYFNALIKLMRLQEDLNRTCQILLSEYSSLFETEDHVEAPSDTPATPQF